MIVTSRSPDAKRSPAVPVRIELSQAQVDQVVRDSSDGGSVAVLLERLADLHETLTASGRGIDDRRLSSSLLQGLLLLASLPSDGAYIGIAEAAEMLDMNRSTLHRYLATLLAVGLIERDPATRRYRLIRSARTREGGAPRWREGVA